MTALEWWETEATDEDVWGGDGRDLTGPIIAALRNTLGPAGTVLDYGCGPGRLALPVSHLPGVNRVIGLDPVRRFVQQARRSAGPHGGAYFYDLTGLDGRTFDAAYCVNVFQHLDGLTVRRALHAVNQSLRIGARLTIQFVPGQGTQEGPRSWLHSTDAMECWCLDAGFSAVRYDEGLVLPEWDWLTVQRTA